MSEPENWRNRFWNGDAVLADFERLRHENDDSLRVDGLALTDEVMAIIGSLRTLKRLNLRHCSFTETGIGFLGALTGLDELVLAETTLTDNGLKQLTLLNSVTWLDVRYTFLTEAGIESFAGFTRLRTLMLSVDLLPGRAILDLLPRLPDCDFCLYGGPQPFTGEQFHHGFLEEDDKVMLNSIVVDEEFSAYMQICLRESVSAIPEPTSPQSSYSEYSRK